MEWVKTTAKTIPEAIDLALDNLGVDEAEAEIEIIEEPKSALFGLRTKGVARVKARVKPKPIRPKQTGDRKNGRRRGPNNRNGGGSGGGKRTSNNRNQRSTSGGSGQNDRNQGRKKGGRNGGGDGGESGNDTRRENNRSKKTTAAAAGTAAVAAGAASSVDKGGAKNDGGGRRGRGRNRNGGDRNDTGRGNGKSKATRSAASNDTTPEKETPVEEVATHLKGFLRGLTDAFGLEGDVSIDDSEPNALIASVDGQHGLMVGPKGRTLDAIQELARISSQRTAPSSIRIKVDVGGYRAKRNEALAGFAQRAADKAVDNGAEVALEPMTPADRKVVHDALTDDNRVETRSVGSEPRRKVLVVPVATDAADEAE